MSFTDKTDCVKTSFENILTNEEYKTMVSRMCELFWPTEHERVISRFFIDKEHISVYWHDLERTTSFPCLRNRWFVPQISRSPYLIVQL